MGVNTEARSTSSKFVGSTAVLCVTDEIESVDAPVYLDELRTVDEQDAPASEGDSPSVPDSIGGRHGAHTDTMGPGDGDVPDSVGGQDDEDDEDDEDEDEGQSDGPGAE